MKIIKKIQENIDGLKNVSLEEVEYRASSYDTSVKPKSYMELKDVDIDKVIKNVITLQFVDLKFQEYKEMYEKLKQKDFTFLYTKYEENHVPTIMERIELFRNQKGQTVTSIYQELAFAKLGIWDETIKTKNFAERKALLDEEVLRQENKCIDEIFPDDFLEDVCAIDLVTSETLKMKIYKILENKYDSFVFNKRKDILAQRHAEGKEVLKLVAAGETKRSIILEYVKIIKSAKQDLMEIKQNFQKQIKSKVSALEKTKSYLEDLEHLPENIDKINFDLLLENQNYIDVFLLALQRQQEEYKQAQHEYEEVISLENKQELEQMLSKYNIDYSGLEEEIKQLLTTCKNLDTFEKNLSYLQIDETIPLSKALVEVLMHVTNKEMNAYAYLIHSHIISKETLCKHLEVFNEKEENFKDISEILLKENLSSSLANYDENILFLDCTEVKKNEKLLSSYQLEKGTNNFNVLFDSYYYDALDFLLEHSMDMHLLDQYSITHEEIDNFMKRCQICLNVGIDIYTKSGNINRSFLLGNGFYCPDAALDDYLMYSEQEDIKIKQWIKDSNRNHISDKVYTLDVIQNLEKYKSEDALAYDLNGVIISRSKVLRNVTLFYEQEKLNEKTLLQAIVYNSNLNEEEITKVRKIALPDYKEKTKDKQF